MPMFSWRVDPGETISKSFWIYWVVTLPLTFTVAGIWIAWAYREDLKRVLTKVKKLPKRKDSETASKCDERSESLFSSSIAMHEY